MSRYTVSEVAKRAGVSTATVSRALGAGADTEARRRANPDRVWDTSVYRAPVANAASLYPHNRNKSDEILHALRDNGGMIGGATCRNIISDHYCASTKAWGTMVARAVDIVGIDDVGIGTDRGHGMTAQDYLWMRNGRWTRSEGFAAGTIKILASPPPPAFFARVEGSGNLVDALGNS